MPVSKINELKIHLRDLADALLKRRLLCAAISYIVAMLCMKENLTVLTIVFVFIFLFAIIFYSTKLKLKYVVETCIIILIFYVFGCCIMYFAKDDKALSHIREGERIELAGTIIDREEKDNSIAYTIRIKSVYHLGLFYISKEDNIYIPIGSTIRVTGNKKLLESQRNEGQFNSRAYYKSKNIDLLIDDASVEIIESGKFSLKEHLRKFRDLLSDKIDINSDENGNILKGILLGDKSGIGDYEKELYQRGGISHILAISGLHVTNIAMLVSFVLIRLRIPKKLIMLLSSLFLVMYALFSGFSSSVVRATCMYIVSVMAAGKGKKYDIPTAMAVSFVIYSIIYPYSAFSSGTIMSYSAVLSIWLFSILYKKIHIYKITDKVKKVFHMKIYKPIALGMFLTFFSLPVVLYNFYTIPIFSVVLNLYVISMMTVLFIMGIAGIIVMSFSGYLAGFLFKICSLIISSFTILTDFFTRKLSGVLVVGKPEISEIIIYYLILSVVLFLVGKVKRKKLVMLIMLIPVVMLFHKPAKDSVTMLDVDQGECIVITTKVGNVFMIDCGSLGEEDIYKYRVEPYLLANGIGKIDCVFLSHSDSDHINGMIQYLENEIHTIKVDNIIVTPQMLNDEEVCESIINPAAAEEIQIKSIKSGDVISFKNGEFLCLYPDTEVVNSDTNADSMVLSLNLDGVSILFTGDLPGTIENKLALSEYDILKVSHHGSKTATSREFLKRISPEIALISCGIDNSYGHPAKEVLENLVESDVTDYITAWTGQIRVKIKKDRYRIQCH